MNLLFPSSRRLFTLLLAFVLFGGLAACDAVVSDADLGNSDGLAAGDDLSGLGLDDDFVTEDDILNADVRASLPTGSAALLGDECIGIVGAVTVENIIVPDGATCELRGTNVQANVEVGGGATLLARSATVGGNIQSAESANVGVVGTAVGGSVQLFQGETGLVRASIVNGDVQVMQNTARFALIRNTVGANMQVEQNTGGVRIQRNNIEENLQCSSNDPAPTGSGNVAASKEDQCENL